MPWKQGNHGRIGDKGVGQPQDNIEVMLAWALAALYANDPIVDIFAEPNPVSIMRIGELTTGMAHGDHMGSAKAPAVMGYMTKQAKMNGVELQLFLTAHYHQAQMYSLGSEMAFCASDFAGGDEYSAVTLGGLHNTPTQWVLAIDGPELLGTHAVRVGPVRTAITPMEVAA